MTTEPDIPSAGIVAAPVAGQRAARSPIRLVALLFWLQPIAYGSWLPRLPEIREHLSIGPMDLAVALLGAPIGILISLPFSGALVATIGTRRTLRLGFATFLLLIALPAFAPSVPWLFASPLVVGAAMSVLELGLNVSADRVETTTGKLVMNMCHGYWSLGLMTGSAIGATLAWLAVPPGPSLLVLALALLPVSLAVVRSVGVEDAAEPETPHRIFFRPSVALLSLCAFVFGITLTEGAAADWAAIFMRDVFGWPHGAAALAFTCFAAMVAAGRFLGDRMKRSFGASTTARIAGSLSLVGVALLIGPKHAPLAIAGFALLGLGLSVGFPLAVSAAAAIGDRPAAANVAFLSMIALSGFLVGPPMIGAMAEHFDMRTGFAMVLPGLLLSLACTFALTGREPASPLARTRTSGEGP